MKLPLLKLTLAALAGVLLTQAAHATTYAAVDNDIILSFTDGGPTDVQVDLGNITQFTGNTFVPINVLADLTNTFGANWYTNSTLQFTVAGVNESGDSLNGYNNNSVFIGNSTTTPDTKKSSGSISSTAGDIDTLYQVVGAPGIGANTDLVTHNINGSISSSIYNGNYENLSNSGPAGAFFGQVVPPELYLNVFSVASTSAASTSSLVTTGGILDVFSVNAAGLVTFGPAVAAPEPSTYALMALGAAGLVFFARRKSLGTL